MAAAFRKHFLSKFCLHFLCLAYLSSVGFSAEGQTHETEIQARRGFLVALDPGHGGRDSATRAGGVLEKNITLRIALKVKTYLEEKGFRVNITRDSDVYIPLVERSALQGDAFISLHCNSVADSIGPSVREMIKGIEIYSETNMTGGETLVKKSQLLATTFKSSLAALTGISLRAVKQKPLAVLRENRSPAILIELGYLSHPVDLDFLKDGNNDQQLAEAFFKALNAFQKHMQKY